LFGCDEDAAGAASENKNKEGKTMKLLLQSHRQQLAHNGVLAANDPAFDPEPVVKLFTPWGANVWLLAWTEPDEPDIAYGLCDLGMGFPELGSVRLSELQEVRGPFGLGIERDLHWAANKTLSAYADEAYETSRTVA